MTLPKWELVEQCFPAYFQPAHSLYGTVKFTAKNLKSISVHDFSKNQQMSLLDVSLLYLQE